MSEEINKPEIEKFRQELLSQEGEDKEPPKPEVIGAKIALKYSNSWSYCEEYSSWLAYSLETEGIWQKVSKEYLAAEVHTILQARNIRGYGTNAYINKIIRELKEKLARQQWEEKSPTEWLPFRNGVFELATGKLHPHSPEFRFTWQIPRDYSGGESGWRREGETGREGDWENLVVPKSPSPQVPKSHRWKSIDNWLNEATQGNQEYKELLLCFAAGVLRGRNDLQKFLHLIGRGGTTFTNLLTDLIGSENTVELDLEELDEPEEIARLVGKRLLVLPLQRRVPKKMRNFKRLLEQEPLSGTSIWGKKLEFRFEGLMVVTSDFPLFHSRVGSWLTKRVKMIPVEERYFRHKQWDGQKELTPELGAFTSYLLSIPKAEIEATLLGDN